MGDVWQPLFYALCALSVAVITAVVYAISPGTWWDGFVVGYGVASTLGLVFLSIQHWSLRASTEAFGT